MPLSTSCWTLLSFLVGITLALASGATTEEGCDLRFSQPCRTNASLCVPHKHVGDGVIDCPDGSDEDCREGWFICKDLSNCIEPRHYQDGVPQCHDESDEACEYWQHECLCGFPRCIDMSKVGDGVEDCIEGSDEHAIEKEAYICPIDHATVQEILRKKRAFETQDRREINKGGITNYYASLPGVSLPLGVLTSTVYSFVNRGTTSEYLTHIKGTSLGGSYAQITSHSSRTFFALPTRLRENQVNGLVSSFMRTTVSNGYTRTIVSRIYHTNIDGSYAQLVETETKGMSPTSVNYVTILQGEELHGTFLSHPDESLATLQFSHLEGSLNPAPVAAEIVTVTGTYGKFIRDGVVKPTTYSVFTGSYVKDHKTYVFFFGNSALPHQSNMQSMNKDVLKMKQGPEKRKVILDMENDMEVIMPSDLEMMSEESKKDLLVGEGMVDGNKLDGLFIADSEGFDVKGAHRRSGGDIKMLTVTIGQPSTVIMNKNEASSISHEVISLFDQEIVAEQDNEVDSSLHRGRKADVNGKEILITDIHPTRPLPADIPTFVIEEPNQNIGDILLREKIKQSRSPVTSVGLQNDNVAENIKAKFDKFNIGDFGLGDSELPTVTYYGFAEFTTTIADTVVVFTPNSKKHVPLDVTVNKLPALHPRVVSTEVHKQEIPVISKDINDFSTASTKVFNTVDSYPSGLVSSIGGTVVNDDMTTLFTTLVYGTYIQGQYAQVVRSTSSIFYLVSRTETPSITPTKGKEMTMTATPSFLKEEKALTGAKDKTPKAKESLFDSLFNNFKADNAVGRVVDGDTGEQSLNDIVEVEDKNVPVIKSPLPVIDESQSVTTYTFYTTFMKDGTTTISTNYKITTVLPVFDIITKSTDAFEQLSTLTFHTTQLVEGTSQVKSSLKVLSTTSISPTPSSNLFFNILDSEPDIKTTESVTEEINETVTETATESSIQDTTESPGFSLESSLNPDDAVNALYFPRTYYTTYTYFTTFHSFNTSSIVSSLETLTNIVSDDKELNEFKTLTTEIPTYPVTYWTTFTYWTTLVKDNSSITTSSKKTVSNVVNLTAKDSKTEDTLPIEPTSIVVAVTPSQDITTYYTTYTYYTTATMGDSTVITSRFETHSSIVSGSLSTDSPVSETSLEPFGLLLDYSPTQTAVPTLKTENAGEESFDGIINLFTEKKTDGDSSIEPFGSLFGVGGLEHEGLISSKGTAGVLADVLTEQSVTNTGKSEMKTGLLSTIRRSILIGGVTTVLSTNIYGTYVDGLYVQIQSTTSEVIGKTSELKLLGVITMNAGSIIENDITTHFTTQHVGKFVDGAYTEDLLSTSKIEMNAATSVTETNPTKTGRVKEVIGSIIHGTQTTYYHSTVLGTVIAGIYAQKVDSTSRVVTGPSIAFEILSDMAGKVDDQILDDIPTLEPSLEVTINPTSVIAATESLDSSQDNNKEIKEKELKKVHKNRLSFPIRTSNKRRTDVLPFIRRTSTFRKQDALSKVLAGPTTSPPEREVTGKTATIKPPPTEDTKPLRTFRFGSSNPSPTRPFRFLDKVSKKKNTLNKAEKKIPTSSQSPADSQSKADNSKTETKSNFRPFRFSDKAATTGTRSALPISRRNRPSSSESTNKQNKPRFRFGVLAEATTQKPKPKPSPTTTTTTTSPTSNRVNPFAFLGGPISEKRKSIRPRKPETERVKTVRKPIAVTSSPKRKPRPRTRLGGLFPRRRPITPRLKKEGSELNPLYILPDGSSTVVHDDIEIISFNSDDAINSRIYSRKKREANDFGSRTSRGRFARNRQSRPFKTADEISPSPSSPRETKQPFTIANPRPRLPLRRGRVPTKSSKSTHQRSTIQRPSKSRNTLPFRPRRPSRISSPQQVQQEEPKVQTRRKGFRRPSTDSRFKISSRFSPAQTEPTTSARQRRPSQFTVNRSRSPAREPPSRSNPIQSFLERPKPQPKPKPEILPSEDGTLNIIDALTVTREVPVTTTIPLIENGNTVEKKVITASLATETVKPEQITQTEINGEIKLLLSTIEHKQKVTQVFIQPIPTTTVMYSSVFVAGEHILTSHVLPHTIYNIVTATAPKDGNDVQDLLKLLLIQQQQQNPFLAALGLNQPSVQVETRTFVTTVTSLISTEIPIIFRGKPIRTTVVDTSTEVITTTEVTTKTISGSHGAAAPNPLVNPSPFGGLLPLLLQNQLNRKARDIRPTSTKLTHEYNTNSLYKRFKRSLLVVEQENSPSIMYKGTYNPNLDYDLEILPAFNELEAVEHNMATPPLNGYKSKGKPTSRKSFLWKSPAELTPLRRKVRSAQRGNRIRQRVRLRNLGARKISDTGINQSIIDGDSLTRNTESEKIANIIRGPTTYYTTFTYYTTYLDDLDRKIVKSSEETITQVATHGGNVRFDEFTRTSPTAIQKPDLNSMSVQEMFTPEDAIIPGMPRPVPDPVFKDPDPPHGPVIRHDEVSSHPTSNNINTKRRKTIIRLRTPQRARGNTRRERTKVRLSNPVTNVPKDSEPAESINENRTEQQIPREGERRRVRITVTKKRPVRISTDVDDSPVDAGGRKRIVITRRFPQSQATAVASPIDPFMGTVNTLHTVYSYLYSVYKDTVPVSSSTRLVTVSNSVLPTHVNIPSIYQTLSPTSNLYTIEDGRKIATLDDRIADGLTTKIYLSSATLVNLPPKVLPRPTINIDSSADLNLEEYVDVLEQDNSLLSDLQSSLQEVQSTVTASTPSFITSAARKTQRGPLIRTHARDFSQKSEKPAENTELLSTAVRPTEIRSRGSVRFTDINARNTLTNNRRAPSVSSERRNRFNSRRRRPTPSSAPETDAVEPITSSSVPVTEEEIITEKTEENFEADIFASVFDAKTEATDGEITSTTSELPSSKLPPTRPPRPSVRRDDIPIVRRPQSERSRIPSAIHRLKFTSTTESNDQTDTTLSDLIDSSDSNIFGNAVPDEPVVESPLAGFPIFDNDNQAEPQEAMESLSPQDSLLSNKPSDYDYYDYYYDEAGNSSKISPTTEETFDLFGHLGKEKSKDELADQSVVRATPTPSSKLPPNVIYTTYTTSTFLPILGGEQSITLTLLTSSLITLLDEDSIITKSPLSNRGTLQASSSIAPIHSSELLEASVFPSLSPTSAFEDISSVPVTLSGSTSEGGTSVFGDDVFAQIISSQQPVGVRLSIDGRQNLATKIMENGVEVIIAEDKPPLSAGKPFVDIIRPSIHVSPRPFTLPASTLSNQMLLFATPVRKTQDTNIPPDDNMMFHYKTYFTTLTYYNTILQEGQPVIRTSKETISNIVSAPIYVSGNFIEKTKINLETSTYLATQTFTRTIGDMFNPEVITSEEVITQVVVTESPSISRTRVEITPTYSTIVTKTYYTTFTFFKTYDQGVVETETVVSSDIVTETSIAPAGFPLPVVSLTKSPQDLTDGAPYEIFATKTYFTTSTYLTTILQGHNTVTSSHTEITSNIVTEPVSSAVLNTDDIIVQGSAVHPDGQYIKDKFERVGYISVDNNIYKELRTLFATYAHYTTLHDGNVKSNEITKTQILTSTITTTSVPVSLLLDPDSITIRPHTKAVAGQATSALFDSFLELDPSYVDSSTTQNPTASVHVEEGSASGTIVVQDSTTNATLLVRPSAALEEDNVLASSQLSLVETTSVPSFDFNDLLSKVIEPTSTISVLETPTILTLENGEETSLLSGNKIVVETRANGDIVYLPYIMKTSQTISEPSVSASLPVRDSDKEASGTRKKAPVLPQKSHVPDRKESESAGEAQEEESGSSGIGLSPMMSAVLGLIGNTLTGKLAGQGAASERQSHQPILPNNAIVSSEPLLIPVGGAGVSLSSSVKSTVTPEQGFIPLIRRPDPSRLISQLPEQDLGNAESFDPNIFLQPHSPISMEKFGPTFKPPTFTESGFTAMTTGINPTQVSVISGEETIFFEGFKSLNLPPSGQPNSHENSPNIVNVGTEIPRIPVQLDEIEKDAVPNNLLVSHSESQDVIYGENDGPHNRPPPQPVLVNMDNFSYDKDFQSSRFANEEFGGSRFIVATVGLGVTPEGANTLSSSFPIGEEGRRTTVVIGSSTVTSGATTIYDSLFTRPSNSEYLDDYYLSGDEEETKSPFAENTRTPFDFLEGFTIPASEFVEESDRLKTLVRTIADSTTTVTSQIDEMMKSSVIPSKTRLETVTVSSSKAITPNEGDGDGIYSNVDGHSDGANLDYEEENEISRFIESKSPDQDVGEPQEIDLCAQKCSENENCKVFRQEHVCICKPGYSRRTPTNSCIKSDSFQVDIVLETMSEHALTYSEEFKNMSHPSTQYLMKEIDAGIEKALANSEIGDKYHSSTILEFDEHENGESPNLVARVKVDIKNEGTGEKYMRGSILSFETSTTSESKVKSALEESLKKSNYSLGGGEIYALKDSAVLAATDFDECQSEEHNDCHKDAECINRVGSFTCECQPGFMDAYSNGISNPGRECIESKSCSYCNYHGKCQYGPEETTCHCNDWFAGEKCNINMKVTLIAVVSVGAFLLLLLFICLVFCCCRTRDDKKQVRTLRPSTQKQPSTIDRRAMIYDSSSESSEDLTRLHGGIISDGKLPPVPRTPQVDYSIGRRSVLSSMSKDRSVTVHTSTPQVYIPRVKGYTPNRAYTLEREPNTKHVFENAKSREATLVDILDGSPRNRETVLSVHSFGRGRGSRSLSRENLSRDNLNDGYERRGRNYLDHGGEMVGGDCSPRSRSTSRPRHHLPHNGATYRAGSVDRLDSSTHDLNSDCEANSYRYGNRTVSQARSFDETTVRAPIRAIRGESFRSRDVSSQVLSDGMPTNAERDGNSTIVYPQMQLYKPLRESDSMSDLTGGHHRHHGQSGLFE